jgi:hypothetical protein
MVQKHLSYANVVASAGCSCRWAAGTIEKVLSVDEGGRAAAGRA